MRLLPSLALLGITVVSALEDSYYELGYQRFENGKWDAGFNAKPAALYGAGANERVKPKIGAAEHGLSREPINRGHPGIEPKVGPGPAPARLQESPQRPDSQIHQAGQVRTHAQAGNAAPKPAKGAAAQPKAAGAGTKQPAAGAAHQNANSKAAPAAANHANAQPKAAGQNRPAAGNGNTHAKAANAPANPNNAAAPARGQAKAGSNAKQPAPANAKEPAPAKQPAQPAKAAQQVKQAQAKQAQAGNAQLRVAQQGAQQASPMESPSPGSGGFNAEFFPMRAPGDECVATVYQTVTLAPGTMTM